MEDAKIQDQHIYRWGNFYRLPLDASTLSAIYADDIYHSLGFGNLTLLEASVIGKAVLHTAMNACLKHSKGGGQE